MNTTTSFLKAAPVMLAAILVLNTANAQDSEVTITTKSHGDWQVRCEKAKGADKSCVMTQQALVETSGQRLMQANIAKKAEDTLMTLILPLGTFLPAGAVMQIGESDPTNLTISFCAQNGCFVNQTLDDKMLREMNAEATVTVKIQISNGQSVDVPISTKGFTDAHRGL